MLAACGTGTARAASAHAPRHALLAPAAVSLSEYLLQPPDGPPGGDEKDGEEDTTLIERDFPPSTGPSGGQQPGSQLQQPAFGTADTTTRTDSLLMFPTTQFAPVETIGANVLNQGAALDGKPAPSKRGIFGIHPTAIIAAMIALHIVVVGIVAK